MYNPVLHVLPLTSDNSEYNLNLGEILYNEKEISFLEDLYNKKTNYTELKEIKEYTNFKIL